jgi:hypothetical protein
MNVTIPIQTIEERFSLLHKYDAATERFITELSTSEKYELLALIMMVRSDRIDSCGDFEAAHDAAMKKMPAQDLTKYFLGRSADNWQTLHGELQDVIAIQKRDGWDWFEVMHSNDNEDDEDE